MSAFTPITSSTDPLVAEYTALNDPEERRRVERRGGYFVVEGMVAVRRLLASPEWEIRSLLLLPKVAERLADQLAEVDAPVLVADEDVLDRVAGFPIHRGTLASVTRVTPPPLDDALLTETLELARSRSGLQGGGRPLLLVVEALNDHENLGALYRNAAGLGVAAVLLDGRCTDPFYRRSVRVSSGLVLAVPTYRITSSADACDLLRTRGVVVAALSPGGEVDLRYLDERLDSDQPVAILVGAEGPGLSDATMRSADHRVAIDMAGDVDSLNVATAAAIALHHLRGG